MYKDVGMRFHGTGICLSHLRVQRYVTNAVDRSVPICIQALTGPDPPHAYNVHPHKSIRLVTSKFLTLRHYRTPLACTQSRSRQQAQAANHVLPHERFAKPPPFHGTLEVHFTIRDPDPAIHSLLMKPSARHEEVFCFLLLEDALARKSCQDHKPLDPTRSPHPVCPPQAQC
jgi:hypothetical protein